MRISHVATGVAAFTAGLLTATGLRRLAGHRLTITATLTATAPPPLAPDLDRDAVVLPFTRPVATGSDPELPQAPVRCGDTGGRTKAGAPCAARTPVGGRCHHHPMAA